MLLYEFYEKAQHIKFYININDIKIITMGEVRDLGVIFDKN